MANYSCYSKRLLNPFHGVVQIVDGEEARAISTDGINWRIQIRSNIYKTPWQSLAQASSTEHYFIYGIWATNGEMAKTPIHPTLYSDHVEEIARDLIIHLNKVSRQLPFDLQDHFELWLMDETQQQPLVLLDSRIDSHELPIPKHPRWYPTRGQQADFASPVATQMQARASIPLSAHELLIRMMENKTGRYATCQWYQRHADGSRVILQAAGATDKSAPLPASRFPDVLLIDQWADALQQQLIDDYICWQAARLLTLHDINAQRREQLEQLAQHYPLLVHAHYRLYPKVLDRNRLNALLVEAVMRKAR